MAGEHGPLYFELNTGAKLPSVGLGTWKAPPGEVGQAVISAVKAGYRHIDCARVYETKKRVALKELITNGVVKRNDLWTSKLWCSDHAPEDVSKALSKTLNDCNLTMLISISTKAGARGWEPENMLPLTLPDTWSAMESNFSTKKLHDFLTFSKVPPAVNQVECHPVWQQPALHNLCKSKRHSSFVNVTHCCWLLLQQRLLRGDSTIHESLSPYKSLQELWDGDI
ncbi:hypothetical protein MKX01_004792 [Papaver californicum]|nr:hypothetical protein MKX01_004792 [Papaver californicum]